MISNQIKTLFICVSHIFIIFLSLFFFFTLKKNFATQKYYKNNTFQSNNDNAVYQIIDTHWACWDAQKADILRGIEGAQ